MRAASPEALLALGGSLCFLAACARERPWEGRAEEGGATAIEPALAPPAPAATSLLLEAQALLAAGDAGVGDAEEGVSLGEPSPVGGWWVRCYGAFRPGDDPVKDVLRLGMICGPVNGMERHDRVIHEGEVLEGKPAAERTLQIEKGECYRVFATAAPTVVDLDVVVRSSRGALIAGDHTQDRWPIVQPDRPFCPLADDVVTLQVASRRGSGRFATEVWKLSKIP